MKCIEGHTSSKELNLPNLGCSIFMMVCWKERFCERVKSQNGLGSTNLGVRRRHRANVKGEHVEKDSLLPWLCSCRYGWPVVQICALYRSLWPHQGGEGRRNLLTLADLHDAQEWAAGTTGLRLSCLMWPQVRLKESMKTSQECLLFSPQKHSKIYWNYLFAARDPPLNKKAKFWQTLFSWMLIPWQQRRWTWADLTCIFYFFNTIFSHLT